MRHILKKDCKITTPLWNWRFYSFLTRHESNSTLFHSSRSCHLLRISLIEKLEITTLI